MKRCITKEIFEECLRLITHLSIFKLEGMIQWCMHDSPFSLASMVSFHKIGSPYFPTSHPCDLAYDYRNSRSWIHLMIDHKDKRIQE